MKMLSLSEIEQLHRKYAADDTALDSVFTHCRIVWEIAQQLMERNEQLKVDTALVRVGCLLHDIGVYQFEGIGVVEIGREYIKHGCFGYDILKAEGLPEAICRFASHHTGVGLTKAEIIANNLPLPHEDFLAESVEERLIMYADKFTSKSVPPRLNSYESYREHVIRFGEHKATEFDALAAEFGKPDLEPIAQKYHQQIV